MNILGNDVSLNDFLPLFNVSVDPGTNGDNDSAPSVSVEYAPRLGDGLGALKLGLLMVEPEITEAVKSQISDASVSSRLDDELDYSDDVSLTLAYSYEGRLLGRGIGRTRDSYDDLYAGMMLAARENAGASRQAANENVQQHFKAQAGLVLVRFLDVANKPHDPRDRMKAVANQ